MLIMNHLTARDGEDPLCLNVREVCDDFLEDTPISSFHYVRDITGKCRLRLTEIS